MTTPDANERFLQLLEGHKRILYKVANVYCADPEDRRDLMQEIVIQLWRSFPRYDDRFKFSTWMYRVGVFEAWDVAIGGRSDSTTSGRLILHRGPKTPCWRERSAEA